MTSPSAQRIARPAVLAVAWFVATAAWAGDESKPKPASIDQARCNAMGEGFYAVAGSTTCVKISGYIGTGVVFASPGRVTPPSAGPSARHDTAIFEKGAGVSLEARFDTELGPGRLYVQVGRQTFNH